MAARGRYLEHALRSIPRNRQKQKSMTQKDPDCASVAARVLARTVSILTRTDQGTPFRGVDPDGDDHRIVQNTVLTILRRRATIDWVMHTLAQGRVRPRLARVLRWGICQILYLSGLPAAVAVDVCVRFVKRHHAGREAGFVNAVLRRLAAEPRECWFERVLRHAPPYVRSGLGQALHAKWASQFPAERLAVLADLLSRPAPITVRRRNVAGAGVPDCLVPLPALEWDCPGSADMWVCDDASAFFRSPAYLRGDFYIQDPATLAAPAMLHAKPGDRVADLCCAPGGKGLLVAERLKEDGVLFCSDRSWSRLQRVRENTAGLPNCFCFVADARNPPLRLGCVDAVLLDVPCSNTGVVRRRPDVRWRFSLDSLRELVRLQREMLRSGAVLLVSGGRMVYSTCSIEHEENADQVRAFLSERPDFALAEELEILPSAVHDGAYAALLVKRCGPHGPGHGPATEPPAGTVIG